MALLSHKTHAPAVFRSSLRKMESNQRQIAKSSVFIMHKNAMRRHAANRRKRMATLKRKAHEFGKLFGADVALIIREKQQFSGYRSIDHEDWPPPMSHIVSLAIWRLYRCFVDFLLSRS